MAIVPSVRPVNAGWSGCVEVLGETDSSPRIAMKCLLVSDLHYTLKQLDWVDRVGERFELVVIAGDHLDISSAVSLDAQVVVTLKYLRRLHDKTTLLVSSGNHDLTARDAANEKVAVWMSRVRQFGVPSDGDRVEVGETTFTICPWWDGPVARERVDEQLARDAREHGKHWVGLQHLDRAVDQDVERPAPLALAEDRLAGRRLAPAGGRTAAGCSAWRWRGRAYACDIRCQSAPPPRAANSPRAAPSRDRPSSLISACPSA